MKFPASSSEPTHHCVTVCVLLEARGNALTVVLLGPTYPKVMPPESAAHIKQTRAAAAGTAGSVRGRVPLTHIVQRVRLWEVNAAAYAYGNGGRAPRWDGAQVDGDGDSAGSRRSRTAVQWCGNCVV